MSKKRSRNESNPLPKALSYAEFADRVSISIPTARRLVKKHDLKVMRLSATLVRIPLSEIERFEAEATC